MTPERLAEIRASMAYEIGPRPWKTGDPRCHCTHCNYCGALFRTEDIGAHRLVCWAATSRVTIVTLLDEVERLEAVRAAAERLYEAARMDLGDVVPANAALRSALTAARQA